MTVYVVQVCLGIFFSWLVYKVFLKGKASASTNRIFLNLGLIFPFLVPLIPLQQSVSAVLKPVLLPVVNVTDFNWMALNETTTFNWFYVIYALGVVFFVLYHFKGVLVFTKLKKASKHEHLNVYRTANSIMPFSFFGSIFLPEGLSKDQENLILQHEQWHIKLRHSWDVVLCALVQSVLWFFPLLLIYSKDLRKEHEFEVDEKMLTKTPFQAYAETLLHVSLMPIQHAKFHSFSAPTLKTRLIMMTKTQKNNTWKLVFFIPLMGSLIYLNACTKQTEKTGVTPEALVANQVETPPQFSGCEPATDKEMMQCFMRGITELIVSNFKYPKDAANADVTGIIHVELTIGEDGNLKNKMIVKSIESNEANQDYIPAMEAAALAVFEDFPQLTPATKDGNDVSVKYTIPIRFALE